MFLTSLKTGQFHTQYILEAKLACFCLQTRVQIRGICCTRMIFAKRWKNMPSRKPNLACFSSFFHVALNELQVISFGWTLTQQIITSKMWFIPKLLSSWSYSNKTVTMQSTKNYKLILLLKELKVFHQLQTWAA